MKQRILFCVFFILCFIQIIDVFAGKNTENAARLYAPQNKNISLPKNNAVLSYEKEKALKTNLTISKLLNNIQTDPSPTFYRELADIYGYPKRSETIYSDPKDLQGHQQKAVALAIQTYEQGITIFPNAPELYCGLGKLQFCINHDYNTAINIFNKGIEICPSADLYCALVDVYRYGIKDTKLAIEACKKGLKSYYSLNLYLALGNHLSFLSRSRIDYKYKIKCKKEALEAYQNALNFEKTTTEYKTILQSMLTLYCELTDIYARDVDVYAQELSIYQHKALDTFNIAQQLEDFYINEKIKTKIEAISFLLQENNENKPTIQNSKDTEEVKPNNDIPNNIQILNEKREPSNENNIIWDKFVESIKSNAETTPEIELNNSSTTPPNENNIIWGDSLEPVDYTDIIYETNLDYISSNSIVEILNPFEIARSYLDLSITDFNNHSNFYTIQKKVKEKLQICSNYIENNFLYGFYKKLGEIYYDCFSKFENYFHQKTEYLEKTLYYYNCALNYGYHRDNTDIIQKMSSIYYELIKTYYFNLAKHENNVHQKKDYIEKAINTYYNITFWDNSKNYNKINKLIPFCYYELGNIYNFELSKNENDYFQKISYIEKGLEAYEQIANFPNFKPMISTKISMQKLYYVLGNIYNIGLASIEQDNVTKKTYLTKALIAYEKAIQFEDPKIKKKTEKSIEFVQNALAHER
ncbi:MAG: hypothetical protein Q8S31_05025 [Alphaproteobacteria bacterium]|nr:hypothetical protein [Alphaproteobacteria bacterium]